MIVITGHKGNLWNTDEFIEKHMKPSTSVIFSVRGQRLCIERISRPETDRKSDSVCEIFYAEETEIGY